MANPNITTPYAGDVVEEFLRLAVRGNETIDGNHIHIESDISKTRNMQRIKMTDIIQDPAATPTSQGQFNIDNKALTPDDWLVYVEFDPNELRDYWDYGQPTGDFVFTELKPEVQVALMDEILVGNNGINQYMGKAIWQGDKTSGTAPYNKFNGLQVRLAGDSDVVDVSGTTITAGNVIAEIEKVHAASRAEEKANPNYKIFVPYSVWELYEQAVVALNYKGPAPTSNVEMKYKSKQIVPLVGLEGNKMIATVATTSRDSNLWLGLTSMNDVNTIKVDRLQSNSDLFFFKMKMGADTQLKFGEAAVYYTD